MLLVQTRANRPYFWSLVCNFYRGCLRNLDWIEICEKQIYLNFSEKSCPVQINFHGNVLSFYTFTDWSFAWKMQKKFIYAGEQGELWQATINTITATMPITDISTVQSEKVTHRVSQMWWRIDNVMSMHNRHLETYWAWPAIKIFLVHSGPSH